jgi:hypothetical protein
MARRLRPLLLVAFILGTAWNLCRWLRDSNMFDQVVRVWDILDPELSARVVRFEIVLVAGLATAWVLISSYAKDKE